MISLALSPDGRTLLTGSKGRASGAGIQHYQGQLRVWDVATGQERAVLDQTQWVTSVAFSPDGQHFAMGCGKSPRADQDSDFLAEPGQVKLFQVVTLKEVAVFTQADGVSSVAYSPDGQTLATAGGCDSSNPHRGQVNLWDVGTGNERCSLAGLHSVIQAIAFSPDGKFLAVGDLNADLWTTHPGQVKLYEVATGRLHHQFAVPPAGVSSLAFSPAGDGLAVRAGGRDVTFWDALTGKAHADPRAIPDDGPMAYTPDGGLVGLHSVGGPPSQARNRVDLWRPGASKPVTIASRDREYWKVLAISADGTTLAVGGSAPNGPSNSGVAHVCSVPK